MAARLRRELTDVEVAGIPGPVHIRFSSGCAETSESIRTVGRWLTQADAALYRSKDAGKGGHSLASDLAS